MYTHEIMIKYFRSCIVIIFVMLVCQWAIIMKSSSTIFVFNDCDYYS